MASRVWLALMIMAAGCGQLRKPPDPDRRLDVKTSGALFESDTGYKFAALPEPGAGVIRMTVRYPVGTMDDPAGKAGLSHLVEHLVFEIEVDRNGKKTSIGAELGRIALWSNAVTNADSTDYEALIPPEALDDLVRLEVERLGVGCAGLTPEIFAREREVVLNELRQKQGARGAELSQLLHASVYPAGHPYRVVQSVESVSKLTFEDACAFLVGPYRRGKAIVIASGKVDREALQGAAGHHLARAPKRDLTTARVVPPVVKPQAGIVKLRGDVDQPLMMAMWPLPPRASRDYRLLEMATGAISGRLGAFGITYGWGHGAYGYELGGAHAPVLAVGIALSSAGDFDEAKSSAAKAAEYAKRVVARDGDDRDSLQWMYNWHARAEAILARWESLDSRNELVADFLQFDTDDSFLVGRIDELVKADPLKTRELAAAWLAPSRARYVLIEPNTTTATTRRSTYQGGAEAHATFVDASLADKPLPAPRLATMPPSERYTTSNGMKVVLWPHGTASLVHGRLVVDSGRAHEPKGKEGISAFVGAGDVDEDVMTFYGRELAIRVDDLVRSVVWELRSPGYELSDEVKSALRGELKLARAKERRSYLRDYFTALYGANHPYARTAMTEDSLDNTSRDDVMSWARDHIVPGNSIVVIAGKFDPKLVKQHIAYNSDQVSRGSDSRDLDTQPVTKAAFISGVAAKDSPTVEIDIGFVGGSGIDRNYAKRLVLAGVLDAQLAQLRAKRALSYGFSASYTPRDAGGLWSITGEIDAARAAEAATAITAILADLRANPESYRTAFVLARQKVLEELVVNTTSAASMVGKLSYLARFDLPDNYYNTLAMAVAAMTLADFHPFLVGELAVEHQVLGAFGNQAAVTEALRAAQVNPVKAKPGIVDPFQ
jgi:zinc protease